MENLQFLRARSGVLHQCGGPTGAFVDEAAGQGCWIHIRAFRMSLNMPECGVCLQEPQTHKFNVVMLLDLFRYNHIIGELVQVLFSVMDPWMLHIS